MAKRRLQPLGKEPKRLHEHLEVCFTYSLRQKKTNLRRRLIETIQHKKRGAEKDSRFIVLPFRPKNILTRYMEKGRVKLNIGNP